MVAAVPAAGASERPESERPESERLAPQRAGATPCEPPVESSEERLAGLAAAVGPLRRVMAAVAARLVETRAHERLCFARLADYARERPGISHRQLQELARVHRALAELPLLEAALLANLLPWSKVRLIASVATPADELAWIARGRALTVRRLAEEVRRAREEQHGPDAGAGAGAGAGEADPPRACRVTVRCTPAVREQWVRVRELAECVAGRRLNAGQALELVVAEVLSGVPIDPALAPVAGPRLVARPAPGGVAEYEEPVAGRAPAAELPAEVTALAEGLEEADAFELDRRLCEAVRREQGLDAALAPLLRRVRCAESEWRGASHRTLAQFAPEQLSMSASKARALIRLERAGEVCPELRRAWRSGRLSWVKAQCLLPLLLLDIEGPWRPAWVAWAQRVTLRRLEADVERALLLRAGHPHAWQRCESRPERAQDPIPEHERQMCAPEIDVDATEELAWEVPDEVASLFSALASTLRRRLRPVLGRIASPGEVFEAMLELARRSWTARAPGTRRPESAHPVMVRDGWRCAVPGCSSRAELHDHHIVFRSAGGSNALHNRITLCAFHHQRCVHEGRLRLCGRAPDRLVFELGVRRGDAPLARYRSGDVALPAAGSWSPALGRDVPSQVERAFPTGPSSVASPTES